MKYCQNFSSLPQFYPLSIFSKKSWRTIEGWPNFLQTPSFIHGSVNSFRSSTIASPCLHLPRFPFPYSHSSLASTLRRGSLDHLLLDENFLQGSTTSMSLQEGLHRGHLLYHVVSKLRLQEISYWSFANLFDCFCHVHCYFYMFLKFCTD